jgi:integrase
MQGSVTKYEVKDKDDPKKVKYVGYRAQIPHPHAPTGSNRKLEKKFSAPACGGISNAHKAANRWVREQLADIQKGQWRDPDTGDKPLADVLAEWRATWPHKLAPKTQVSYAAIVRRHIEPRWAKTRVDAIDSADIQAWIDKLAGDHSPQTVHNAYTVLRGVMRFARSRKYIEANPCTPDAISLPSKTKHRNGERKQAFLEATELHDLIDNLPERWRCPVWLDALTGLRAGELWGLTRADIDVKRKRMVVRRAIKDVAGHLEVGPTKTHATRDLSIPDEAMPDLIAHLAQPGVKLRGVRGGAKGYAAIVTDHDGKTELGWVEEPADDRRLVFVGERGYPVSHSNFYARVFIPAARRALPALTKVAEERARARGQDPHKASPLRFHDLRHTSASFALEAAGNVEAALTTVQRRLGHKNISVTADIYGHLTRAADEKVADGISAIVKRKPAGKVVELRPAKEA